MNFRHLQSNEIPLIWQIDRREIVENVYYLDHSVLATEIDPELFALEPDGIHHEFVI